MAAYVIYCLQLFFAVLEVIVLLYMIQSILNMGIRIQRFLLMLMYPMLYPMQRLVKHSVLGTFSIDLSPYILLVVLNYLGNICSYLLN
jgi:YGGT family.